MPYDHHQKAGNQGDVVKHPALIAALDWTLRDYGHTERPFHYLDLFAGHAWHPLLDGKEYEWTKGIGHRSFTNCPHEVPAVQHWWDLWHAAPQWPAINPAGYPGSAWIAARRCNHANKPIKLELYDHSEEARRDLEKAFPPSHAIQSFNHNVCLIGQSLGLTDDTEVGMVQPDFVFIDPPGWSDRNPSYPTWDPILAHVLEPRSPKRANKPTLLWMPSSGNSGIFNGKPTAKVLETANLDYYWSAIRWQTDGAATACILIYNCASSEIRAAVNYIVRIAGHGWERVHYPE